MELSLLLMKGKVLIKYKMLSFFVSSEKIVANEQQNEVELCDEKIPEIYFFTFCNAIQDLSYTIDYDNVYYLRYLSKKYGFDGLLKETKAFIYKLNCPELHLSKLFYQMDLKKDFEESLNLIAMSFDKVLKYKKIYLLPFNIMKDVIQNTKFICNNQLDFKNYLLKKYEEDNNFGVFFKLIDKNLFTKNERRMIKSDIKFDDDEITIGELIKQQEKQLNEEELKYEKIANLYLNDSMSLQLGEIHKDIHKMNKIKKNNLEINPLIKQRMMESMNKVKGLIDDVDIKSQDLEFKFGQVMNFINRINKNNKS